MSKFYLILWLKWAIRLTLSSTIVAMLLSFLIVLSIYIFKDMPPFNDTVKSALFVIGTFWFPILWSLSLLLSLFRGIKYIFNDCINGYSLKLLRCSKDATSESIELIGYGDLVRVWRKWLMLMIWLVAVEVIFALILHGSYTPLHWFSIYLLYGFILVAGYFSFMILNARCKKVKIVKC